MNAGLSGLDDAGVGKLPTPDRAIEVALPVPLFRSFTYSVTAEHGWPIAPGSRVVVPFRNRRMVGICLGESAAPEGVKLKPVLSVPDERPSIPAALMALAQWISEWYAAPLGITLRGMLPALLLQPGKPVPAQRTTRMLYIARELPSLLERERMFARAPQQKAVFALLEAHGGVTGFDTLMEQAACSASVINALVKRGVVELKHEAHERDPFRSRSVTLPPGEPSAAQQAAIDTVCEGSAGQTFLLHGITGSGKTLVYIEVLRRLLRKPRSTAIVLVPEIALTPQTVDRFRGAFGDEVAVLHSGLSDGERLDAWRALRNGQRRIAVGARSALFAPLENVAVVIVDEEHEASYKQAETPRYHAREAAMVRARKEGAIVVLGSATPSLESWHRAERGQATRLDLPDRATGASLPRVQLADMREVGKEARRSAAGSLAQAVAQVFSPVLVQAITQRLERHEQVLLLLNRRGYSAYLQCESCGHLLTCPHCSISLTYHRVTNVMMCHYCRYQEAVPRRCPKCGEDEMVRRGLGTQQVERLAGELFPTASIARMDVDTTSGKWAHARILDRVASGEVDILLGTQMIAKGLDFPNVTLVGVVDADTGLNLPDFRASERTFQLLSQVAGRAGRGNLSGEAIVQTRMADAHAIRYALEHDYLGFVSEELQARRMPVYPPFAALANIVLSGRDQTMVADAAIAAADWIRKLVVRRKLEGVTLVGPAPCPIDRIKDRWRWHMAIKTERAALLTQLVQYIVQRCPVARHPGGRSREADIRLVVDRDPVSLL